MHRFIESIRIFNGQIEKLPWHIERLNRTRREILNLQNPLDLVAPLQVPKPFQKGVVKCRVLYAKTIEQIEFRPYQIRPIQRLKIVHSNDVDYAHKYENRASLTRLFQQRGTCDDIIILKNDLVTDSYYANLVFDDGQQLFTPRLPLLKGVRRSILLEEGRIQEADIRIENLVQFERVHLVNAMMELEECVVKLKNQISPPSNSFTA